MPQQPAVLICGAGPTGLLLAYLLARQAVAVRLIDRHAGPAEHSRAMGVHARTLEFYRMLGLADGAVALGIPARAVHLHVSGRERASLSIASMGQGQSPYPFMLTLAQDVHERFLVERLAEIGVAPEWGSELVTLAQDGDAVVAGIRRADGSIEEARVPWVVGCDGARSLVRTACGIGFGGGTTEGLFFVADVATEQANEDVHLGLGTNDLALMMPVRSTGTQRIIGVVPGSLAGREVGFEDLRPMAEALLGVRTGAVNWFSTYRVHHRVADRFRAGRCFIAGDAGHIHSPVGGQGMNTGLGDAMNLGWKLAAVVKGEAAPAILDSYEPERIAFARALIATTDRVFGALVADGWAARQARLRALPAAVSLASGFRATRRALFRAVSQTRIAYRNSAVSEGRAAGVAGGDRMPWVEAQDNFASLDGLQWSLQACGTVRPDLAQAAAVAGVPVTTLRPNAGARAAGLQEGAAYLLRPDGHVGLALPDQSVEAFRSYRARLGLAAPPASLREVA